MIIKKLTDAISKPIIVIQFLEADGSFIELGIIIKKPDNLTTKCRNKLTLSELVV